MMEIALVVFILLQYADGYTTHRILSRGGRELNPFLSGLFNKFGYLAPLIIVKSLFAAAGAWLYLSQQWQVLLALDVVYGAVVAHNLKQMVNK